MIMTYNKSLQRFEVTTTYQEYKAGYVAKVKAARFHFEKEPRPLWHTSDPANASLLISCADDTCRDMLQVRASEREVALAQSRAQDADLGDLLKDLGKDPYDFQEAGIAYAVPRERVFFADEPGLGKTLQALATVHLHKAYPCVAVVPATIKLNWLKEAQACIPELRAEGAVRILKGRGNGAPLVGPNDPRPLLWIINYDILASWLEQLRTLGLQSIILDESHFAKNPKAQRTVASLELATGIKTIKEKGKKAEKVKVSEPIKYRFLLSGTPEPNRPAELEPQLDILGVLDKFGGTWGFRRRFCGYTEKWIFTPGCRGVQKKVCEYKGATNTDELQRMLREYVMVRRLKADVLKSLPPKRHQCIELPANGLQHFVDEEQELERKHEEEVARLKALLENAQDSGDQKTFEEASKLLQKQHEAHFADMARLAHACAMAKVPLVIEYCLELLEGNEKLAVFAHHHDVEDALMDAFRKAGIETVCLTGRESDKQKDAAISAFQEGSARVFIGGLKCGIGYTITAASRCVFAELDWTPGVMDQAFDRLHRIGQAYSVLGTYITLENSLDAKKVGMLISKRDVSNRVLDKQLEDFKVPAGIPEPKPEKPQLPPTHVFELLRAWGIRLVDIPF